MSPARERDRMDKREPAIREPDGPGSRLQQILQCSIAPWKREEVSDEEAQLAELRRRPVRKVYGADEAKRRLGSKPAKRRRTAARIKPATA